MAIIDQVTVTAAQSTASLTANQVEQLKDELIAAVATLNYEYVDVTFTTANTDVEIPITLKVSDPQNIHYEVVRRDRACILYDSRAVTARAWTSSYIVLRSDTANAVVTLRISTPRT